jgi:hypothetical protein
MDISENASTRLDANLFLEKRISRELSTLTTIIIMNSTKAKFEQANTTEAPSSNDASQLQEQPTGDIIPALSGLNLSEVQTDGDQTAVSPVPPANSSRGFNKLPTEIRLKIWQVLLLQPRIIEIEAKQTASWEHPYREGRKERRIEHGFNMVSYPGSRLSFCIYVVNLEKRHSICTSRWIFFSIPSHSIYFNLQVDIFYFGPNSCLYKMKDFSRTAMGHEPRGSRFEYAKGRLLPHD